MIVSKQIMNKRERTCLGWTEKSVLSHLGIGRSMQQGKEKHWWAKGCKTKWRWRFWCRDKCRALEKGRDKGAGKTMFSWEICLSLHSTTFKIWSNHVTAHDIYPTDFLYASHKSLLRLWSTQQLFPFLLHHPFPSCPPPHPVYQLVLQLPHPLHFLQKPLCLPWMKISDPFFPGLRSNLFYWHLWWLLSYSQVRS